MKSLDIIIFALAIISAGCTSLSSNYPSEREELMELKLGDEFEKTEIFKRTSSNIILRLHNELTEYEKSQCLNSNYSKKLGLAPYIRVHVRGGRMQAAYSWLSLRFDDEGKMIRWNQRGTTLEEEIESAKVLSLLVRKNTDFKGTFEFKSGVVSRKISKIIFKTYISGESGKNGSEPQ